MPITLENYSQHELIGFEVKIKGKNNAFNNINGIIIDETRNTLVVREKNKIKRIPKKTALISFSIEKCMVEIEGFSLIGRPEERIKKKNHRIW